MDETQITSGKPNTVIKKTAASASRRSKKPGGASLALSPRLNRTIVKNGKTSSTKFLRATSFCQADGFWPGRHRASRGAVQLFRYGSYRGLAFGHPGRIERRHIDAAARGWCRIRFLDAAAKAVRSDAESPLIFPGPAGSGQELVCHNWSEHPGPVPAVQCREHHSCPRLVGRDFVHRSRDRRAGRAFRG